MRFGILGPLQVWAPDGQPVRIPELKVRRLLAVLLLHRGFPVSADRLVDDLWGDRLPGNPGAVLRSKVSQLRRVLDEAEPGGRDLIVHRSPGYLLAVPGEATDAERFRALVAEAERTDDLRSRATLLGEALELWRGPALADFADEEFARATIAGLEEQRLAALELLAEARMDLGEHNLLVGELADLVERHPHRERLRAVHMRALYRAGRQRDALDGFHRLREELRESLGVDPSPELAALHAAILDHDPALSGEPAPAPAPRATTNLAVPLTELIGREAAIREAEELLDAARLVTLTGPGGVGKTRLATATAATLTDRFRDGVWLVELAGLDGSPSAPGSGPAAADAAAAIAEMITTVLGVPGPVPSGAPDAGGSPLDRLAAVLRGRRLLIVLDNCEHVVEAAAEVVDRLLRAAPELRVLAASREPLGVAGERLWSVPPLAVPGPDAPERDAAALLGYSAVRLFVTRAQAASAGFALDAGNAPAVLTICRRLDGLPLALELAATRVRTLGVEQLAARLDDRFRLLGAGTRGAPARQRTLRAMIDWSWELLSADERTVLRRLAVHSGGCTLESAEAVCSGGAVPVEDVLATLATLVDRSLVVLEETPDGARYRLLESVAAYCLERLREADELDRVRLRHAAHYTELAERADPNLRGPEQRAWLRRLDLETLNLRAALDAAVRQGEQGLAVRLACALAWYWTVRGRLDEGTRSLSRALAVPGEAAPGLRLTALTWQCALSAMAGRTAGPAALPSEVLGPLPADVADPRALTRARGLLAVVIPSGPDAPPGETLPAQVLADARALGDEWGVAAALSTLAWGALLRGDHAALRRDAERSAALFRSLGDQWGVLNATDPLATLARLNGDWARARTLHLENLRVAQELGLWPKVAFTLCELGRIAVLTGDYSEADELYERARKLAVEQSNPVIEQSAEVGMAVADRRRNRLDPSVKRLLPWLDWNRQMAWPDGLATVQTELGFVAEQRGDAEEALARHRDGYAAARETGEPRAVALALEGLSGAYSLDGAPRRAARLLGAAAAVRDAAGTPLLGSERADADRVRARTLAALGEPDFAAEFARGRSLPPDECPAGPALTGIR
ncbi:BTAD domain-containing putative transcriptional regulator [Actinoallomurus sp. NPDC050550]|uniref:BTAD domain-containing putative transcriptional regulator n=1 Tax=Actinoallomurus sp. NPDC050550 TaxID=3154937 RepID=UPI003408339C